MYYYSIMMADTAHAEEICSDIVNQYKSGIADCVLFEFTLNPEGTPPVNKAAICGKSYDLFRDLLAAKGAKCGILIQASIGHGWKINAPFPFQKYVGLLDGKEINVCCPYDPGFRQFFRSQTKEVASHRPEVIMLDDDFRLVSYRSGGGCACPLHMAEFNRRAGTHMTREELKEKIHQNPELAEIFLSTQHDSLIEAVREYRAGIDEVDPSIPGIFCACGMEYPAEIAKIFAGSGNPIIVRLNNGNYTPAGARGLIHSLFRAANEVAVFGDECDALLAETDTCPQNRYSTSAHSLHSQFTGTILEGATGAKHWITRLGAHEPNSGKAYRALLKKYNGFYHALSDLVPTLKPFGCRIPMPDVWRPYLSAQLTNGWGRCVLEWFGFPTYFSKHSGGAVFLDNDTDAFFTDDQIADMLSGPVFMTGKAAEHLIARGFGDDLGVSVRPWTGVPLSGEMIFVNGECCKAQERAMELIPLKKEVKSWSSVYHIPDGKTKNMLFPGVTSYQNVRGGTAVVFCGDPDTHYNIVEAFSFLNESRKLQMTELLKSVGHLPVWYPEDAEIFLRGAETEDGSLFVALFNLGLDPLEEIPLSIGNHRNIDRVEFLDCNGSRQNVSFRRTESGIVIDLPAYTLTPVILFLSSL